MQELNFKDVLKGDTLGEKNINISNATEPINLTGVLIKCQFRLNTKVGVLAKEISHLNGIDIYDAINGNFRIQSFIVDWNPGLYYYDVQFTFPDNKVITYFGGHIKVIQDVTQN